MSNVLLKLLLASPALVSSGLVASGAIAAESLPSALEPTATSKELAQTVTPAPAELLAQAIQPQPAAPVHLTSNAQPQVFAQSRTAPSVDQLEADPLRPKQSTASMSQVTSVSQLSDVRPTDWAFQALQSLVEKYGCIAGYPDGTFRGNRAATRYELAAALNACLDVISDRFATKEDLAAVRKLQEEFAAELATLRGRVDGLEARTAKLEAQQFSTTTKLRGVAVFSFSDSLAGNLVFGSRPEGVPKTAEPPGGYPDGTRGGDPDDNPIVTYRVRLNLDTSFTGKDLLRTRLQAANVPNYNNSLGLAGGLGFSNSSRLGYEANSGGLFTLDKLFYRFPVFGKGTLQVDALRLEYNDNVFNFNPVFESSDRGALSRFGRFNPIYRISGEAGVTFNYPVIVQDKRNVLTLSAAYSGGLAGGPFSAGNPSNPGGVPGNPGGSGLWGGPYSALAQVEWAPLKDLRLGFTYVYSYGIDVSGGTGTTFASNPFGTLTSPGQLNFGSAGNAANNVGFQFTWRAIPKLTVSGWAGYSQVYGVQGVAGNSGQNLSADVINWGLTLGAPDLWRKGDLAGLIIGTPPTVISSNADQPFLTSAGGGTDVCPNVGGCKRVDQTLPFLVEGLYRFQVNPNISVTPGVIAVFNANGNDQNDPVVLGVIRTTFTF
uniref:Carbohydrate-selective porin OprB n=1 Tax=Cyanothece sp. (strain PCC 7425 / ATCC 29141) TaxID=395961 RepID=B8HY16_CYAP4